MFLLPLLSKIKFYLHSLPIWSNWKSFQNLQLLRAFLSKTVDDVLSGTEYSLTFFTEQLEKLLVSCFQFNFLVVRDVSLAVEVLISDFSPENFWFLTVEAIGMFALVCMDFNCCHLRSAGFWACLYGALLWRRMSESLKYSVESELWSSLQKSDFSLADFVFMVGPFSLIRRGSRF